MEENSNVEYSMLNEAAMPYGLNHKEICLKCHKPLDECICEKEK